VARVAEKFGGGGHKNASGCTIAGDFDQVRDDVVERLREAVLAVTAAT
jgi:phosphoesterase RecJ-like protein